MISGVRVLILVAVFILQSAWAADAPELRFMSKARQITFQGKSGEGYFSPDGSKLIFQSTRDPDNPFYQIYILDLETGDTHQVSPGEGKTTCAFFQPGTKRVLFASTHHDSMAVKKQEAEIEFRKSGKTRRYEWDYDPEMDIFTANQDGSDLRRLTDAPGYDAEGAFSPDGRKIVFSSLRNAYPLSELPGEEQKRYELDPAYFAEIYIMDADGSNQRRLTSTPGYDGGPFFSADGERIIWRRFEEGGLIADVYSMNLDGSDVRRITHFKSMSWAPYPHPSGKYIIFTSNQHGFENFELFITAMDGSTEPVRVTNAPWFDGLPVFSPDGKRLAWTSSRTSDEQSQLILADWDHDAALAALVEGPATVSAQKSESARTGNLSSSIQAEDAHQHVSVLAADEMQGRLTGTEGARKAAEYIAQQLEHAGVEPVDGTYFQPFEFTAGVNVLEEQTSLAISNSGSSQTFKVNEQFRPFSFSANGTAEGPVVFAGYGLSVPGQAGEGYDSYAGLDVTNKIVLVLRYVPEEVSQERRQELNRYAALRYKAMIARERGAKAILVVTGPNSPNPGRLYPLSSDGSLSGSEIIAASVSTEVADAMLQGSGTTLAELQSTLDTENPHAQGSLALTNVSARVQVALEHEQKQDRNVLGAIPPTEGEEYVMLGAHYDHLGLGEGSGSRQGEDETGEIHNGADDNASGVAAVLELAAYFAEARQNGKLPGRGILFAFWSGEELGLLGSSKFVERSPVPLSNIVAYINFDMIGRVRENKLTLQGLGSSPVWKELIEKRNIPVGFSITTQTDPYLPTDVTAIYPRNIPVLAFFSGSHKDYHRPSDDVDTLNYEGIERAAHLARGIVTDLIGRSERPEYVKVERQSMGGSRDGLRAYLGTIPDYATDVKGVKLSGVQGGSPAAKAGLQGGDVIIQFAGQQIANIYDYTYALDAVKIGQPVKMTVQREGREVELTITPEARK